MYDKIKALAEKKGVSIVAIEKACGLSNGSIVKWKKVSPNSRSLKAVADYLGVSTDWLLRDDG